MSPRRDIRMSAEEVDAFLRSQSRVLVTALPSSGGPEGAVGRLIYAEGRVAFALREDDPVVALLAADSRTCCVVERFPSYFEITGVMLHGHSARRPAAAAAGEAVYDLRVDKVVSFDFGKLPRD